MYCCDFSDGSGVVAGVVVLSTADVTADCMENVWFCESNMPSKKIDHDGGVQSEVMNGRKCILEFSVSYLLSDFERLT